MFKAITLAVAGASAASGVAADCQFGRSTQVTTTITFQGLDDQNDVSSEHLKALCGIISNQAALFSGADEEPSCEHAVGGVPVKVATVITLPHVLKKAELIADMESFVALDIENAGALAELADGGSVHVAAEDVASICTIQDSRRLAEGPVSAVDVDPPAPQFIRPGHPNDGNEGNEGNEGSGHGPIDIDPPNAKFFKYPGHSNDGNEGNEGNEGDEGNEGKFVPGYLGPNHPNDGDEGNEGNEGGTGARFPGYLGPNHPNDGDEGNEGNEGRKL